MLMRALAAAESVLIAPTPAASPSEGLEKERPSRLGVCQWVLRLRLSLRLRPDRASASGNLKLKTGSVDSRDVMHRLTPGGCDDSYGIHLPC